MDALDFFLLRYAEVHRRIADEFFTKLTESQLRGRPTPGVNPVGWLLWHTARIEDVGVNRFVADRPQVLDDGGDDRLNRLTVGEGHHNLRPVGRARQHGCRFLSSGVRTRMRQHCVGKVCAAEKLLDGRCNWHMSASINPSSTRYASKNAARFSAIAFGAAESRGIFSSAAKNSPTDSHVLAEIVVNVGAHGSHLEAEVATFPRVTTTESGVHLGVGLRRELAKGSIGARAEIDDVGGDLLLAVRALDYRRHLTERFAVTAFLGLRIGVERNL